MALCGAMSNRARRIGVGSSGAARDDVEHQSQHRHSDGDCSNRQQDFDGRVRPFHGTRQGIEIAHRPIVDPPGQPPVLQLLAARSWEFLSPPNCAVEVFVHARRHGLIVLIGNVFAYHLRVQEALTANAAMPLVACEDVRTPLGAFRVVFGIGHRLNNRSVMSRRKKKPRRSGTKYRGNGERVLPQQGNLRSGKWFQ